MFQSLIHKIKNPVIRPTIKITAKKIKPIFQNFPKTRKKQNNPNGSLAEIAAAMATSTEDRFLLRGSVISTRLLYVSRMAASAVRLFTRA
jgi:hypothetical protein